MRKMICRIELSKNELKTQRIGELIRLEGAETFFHKGELLCAQQIRVGRFLSTSSNKKSEKNIGYRRSILVLIYDS